VKYLEGDTLRKIGLGCAVRFPKTLLYLWAFLTKICDFSYPIYDLTKKKKKKKKKVFFFFSDMEKKKQNI